MRIAINILPFKTGHKDRGIGFYTSNLIEGLKAEGGVEVQEFLHLSEVINADVVHYPWFDFYFHTLPIKKAIKTVVTIHDVIPLKFSQHYPVGVRGRYNLFLQKLALKNCEIITDSKISKKDIVNFLKVDEKLVTPIYLASDENFKMESDTKLIHTKRKYNLPNNFLLYVGDANWIKNLPFLIEGFQRLIMNPQLSNLKLVLAGGVFLKKIENIDHPELRSLKEVEYLIKKYGLDEKILRPGDLSLVELVSFYNLATLYIQPSLYEGFGFPLLEAFSCGTPVISSNQGSLPEVGGEAAVYFDPTKLNEFVSIMTEVLEDNSLQSKMSKLGLKRAQEFSWSEVARETKNVYNRLIKND